jgi:hypothetical protein
MKLSRVRDKARKLFSHTLGSIVSGIVVGASVFGAIAYDDIAKGYDEYPGARKDFYTWVLQFPVLAGALSGASVYFFLPELFRFLGREASLSDRLSAYADQLAIQGANPEEIAIVLDLIEQAKRMNA